MNNRNRKAKNYVRVLLTAGSRSVLVKALVDTGNTVSARAAIPNKIHKQLHAKLSQVGGKAVGTACPGAKITTVGVSEPLVMQIEGINKKFKIAPVVMESLTDDLNLGNQFFTGIAEKLPCEIEYLPNKTHLKIGGDQVEMIRTMSEDNPRSESKPELAEPKVKSEKVVSVEENHALGRQADQNSGRVGRTRERMSRLGQKREKSLPNRKLHVYAKKDMVCRANTLTFVEANLEKPGGQGITVLVEPNTRNLAETVGAVYSWKEESNRIAVLNPTKSHMIVKAGAELGYYTCLKEVERKQEDQHGQIRKITTEISDQLLKDLKIQENELLKKEPELQRQVVEIIKKYSDVFSSPESQIGRTDLIEFDIELVKNAKPVRMKVRPLNPLQKQSLKEQLDLWKREGTIEESNSPWASALVPAKKKGGKIRWAVDYRILNSMTIADAYPLPNIEDNLEQLQGSKIFSCLDAAAAYHVVPVSKRSRPYLAFITPYGLFTFKRMPFGPRNSGAVYSRMVELCIQKMRSESILAYLDDVLIHTSSLSEHVKQLELVLEMHRAAGIKLRPQKTKLFEKNADYLGYKVSQDGVEMQDSYVQRIMDWPVPKTVKEMNTFLGFVNYYRSFIKDFSILTASMNEQRKAQKLEWTQEMDDNFKKLKAAFETKPIRAYPLYNTDEPFQVTTDFSSLNIGAVLSQVQFGKERMIAALGRKTTKYESNYPSTKGELCAFVYSLKKFEHILLFKKFIWNTDSGSLRYLQTLKNPTGIFFRWTQYINMFNFEIRHRPGKLNTNADAISRSSHMPPPELEDMEDDEESINKLHDYMEELEKNGDLKVLNETGAQLSKENLSREQKEDEIVREVRRWVSKGQIPTKESLKGKPEELKVYAQIREALEIKDDLLYYPIELNQVAGQKMYRIVIPEKCRDSVFHWCHQHQTAGHFGGQSTVLRAKTRFYYPGMTTDLIVRAKSCPSCLAKINKTKIRDTVHKPNRSGYPGEKLFVDLVGPLSETHDHKKYILTIEDAFTRHVQAFPIPNKETATVAMTLIERYISVFGIPEAIHSDNGKEFVSKLWQEMMDLLQITKTSTPNYNPQSNSVERYHRTLNSMLRVMMSRDETEWGRYLPAATLAYNTKVHSSTGLTPYFAMFGRECRLPIDLIVPSPEDKNTSIGEHVRATLARFKQIYGYIRKNGESVIRRNAKLYSGNKKDFKIGDRVWYLCPRKIQGKPTKITDQWLGPYKIIKKPAEVLLTIEPAEYKGPAITVHMGRVVPCRTLNYSKQRIPARLATSATADELGEEIRPPQTAESQVEIRVPVQVATPSYEIIDLPREQTKNTVREVRTSSNQTEPENVREEAVSEVPMDTDQRGQKRVRESEDEEDTKKSKESVETETMDVREASNTQTNRRSLRQNKRKWRDLLPTDSDDADIEALRKLDELDVSVSKDSSLPTKGTNGSAAYDICAHQTVTVRAGEVTVVPLNLRLAIPEDHFLLLLSRSGLASKGIYALGGVIDSDYRKEVKAIIKNSTAKDFKIKKGQRIVQGVFLPAYTASFKIVDQLNGDEEVHVGFGSTGDGN